jgi:histidyl-tRNA synthetase
MAERFQTPPGTHDILPRDQRVWFDTVVATMEQLARRYGYRRIQTPVFEDTDLFARTSGAGSDVVQKEMYTFVDRGGRSLTLRPEGTAPICRAYVEHGMHREPQPVKLYTIASMYRYAKAQKGRYREHWQLSVEAIGSPGPEIDAEVIQLYWTILAALGVTEFELQLNSIGDARCRPAYVERLNAWLDANAALLDDEARQKRATSPLRVFDVKNPSVRALLEEAPKVGDSLCEACREHFAAVRGLLDAYGVSYVIEPTLVRGLDYYTRTTWEFVGPEHGAQSTLSGGGRYDGLVAEIGGPPTPGIGFGAGIERLIAALPEQAGDERWLDAFVAADGEAEAFAVLRAVRDAGFSADADYAGRSLRGQLTLGQRRARNVVIAGADGLLLRRPGERDRPVDIDGLLEELARDQVA